MTSLPVPRVNLKIDCQQTIESAIAKPVALASGYTQGLSVSAPGGKTMDLSYKSPSWTPNSPIMIDVGYSGGIGPADCTFTQR